MPSGLDRTSMMNAVASFTVCWSGVFELSRKNSRRPRRSSIGVKTLSHITWRRSHGILAVLSEANDGKKQEVVMVA